MPYAAAQKLKEVLKEGSPVSVTVDGKTIPGAILRPVELESLLTPKYPAEMASEDEPAPKKQAPVGDEHRDELGQPLHMQGELTRLRLLRALCLDLAANPNSCYREKRAAIMGLRIFDKTIQGLRLRERSESFYSDDQLVLLLQEKMSKCSEEEDIGVLQNALELVRTDNDVREVLSRRAEDAFQTLEGVADIFPGDNAWDSAMMLPYPVAAEAAADLHAIECNSEDLIALCEDPPKGWREELLKQFEGGEREVLAGIVEFEKDESE